MALATDKRWQLYVASGVGSCAADFGTNWIDVVKVRLQVSTAAGASKTSAWQVSRDILSNEGVRGFLKGLSPALLRASTYGSLRLGMYEPIKDNIVAIIPSKRTNSGDGQEAGLHHKILSGALSGSIAQAICCPTDVVKIRMQVDTAGTRYSGIMDAFVSIFRSEGIRGMYQGVTPAAQRAAVVAAVELSTYDSFKMMLIPHLGDNIKTQLCAALMAGFLSTFFSSPLDVFKSRLMSQRCDKHGKGLEYRGMMDCARQTMQKEGAAALWRGFWPNYARLGPHNLIMWLTVEQIRGFFLE